MKDLMYFLGVAELLSVKILMLISRFSARDFDLCLLLEAILYSYLCTSSVRCLEIGGYPYLGGCYFYGKINQGHVVCPLYGGGPYLREFVMA